MSAKVGRTGKWLLALVVLVAGGAASCLLDMPVHNLVSQYGRPVLKLPLLGDIVSGIEEFGRLVPIVVVGMAVWRLDRRHGRKVMLRILLAALLASLASECSKAVIGRVRPRWFDQQAWSRSWLGTGLRYDDGKRQSFFSGHTSAVFAAATVVGTCYPPVRPVAMVVAAGCGMSRIAVQQHWMSDVYVGAIVGIAIGWWLVPRCMRRPERLPAFQVSPTAEPDHMAEA